MSRFSSPASCILRGIDSDKQTTDTAVETVLTTPIATESRRDEDYRREVLRLVMKHEISQCVAKSFSLRTCKRITWRLSRFSPAAMWAAQSWMSSGEAILPQTVVTRRSHEPPNP